MTGGTVSVPIDGKNRIRLNSILSILSKTERLSCNDYKTKVFLKLAAVNIFAYTCLYQQTWFLASDTK